MTDRLRELAVEVAGELQRQPGWDEDCLEVRDTFDAFVDAALQPEKPTYLTRKTIQEAIDGLPAELRYGGTGL